MKGVRDRIGEAVQPEEIYDLFLSKLEKVLSKEVIQKSILESFVTKKSMMKKGKNLFSGFCNGNNTIPNSKKKRKKLNDILNDNEMDNKNECEEKTESISSEQENGNFLFGFSF